MNPKKELLWGLWVDSPLSEGQGRSPALADYLGFTHRLLKFLFGVRI